jgi:hypothetical protein
VCIADVLGQSLPKVLFFLFRPQFSLKLSLGFLFLFDWISWTRLLGLCLRFSQADPKQYPWEKVHFCSNYATYHLVGSCRMGNWVCHPAVKPWLGWKLLLEFTSWQVMEQLLAIWPVLSHDSSHCRSTVKIVAKKHPSGQITTLVPINQEMVCKLQVIQKCPFTSLPLMI